MIASALARRVRPLVAGLLLLSVAKRADAEEKLPSAPEGKAPAQQKSAAASPQARRDVAEARFKDGVAAYAAGRYKDAIDAFQAADAVLPSARLSFNTALAYEHLFDTANALRWYRDYLRRSTELENAERVRTRVEQLERELMQRGVQQLTVFSSPEGATVSIDGRPLGVTPWTGELPPGAHQLTLSLKAHEDVSRSVELPKQHAIDVNFSLPVVREIAVASQPQAPSAAAKSHPLGVWPWISLGLGGGALLAAGAFELSRRSAADDARSEPTQLGYLEKAEAVQSRQRTARIFAVAGGGLLLTSGILFLVDSKVASPKREATLAFDANHCFMSYRSAF